MKKQLTIPEAAGKDNSWSDHCAAVRAASRRGRKDTAPAGRPAGAAAHNVFSYGLVHIPVRHGWSRRGLLLGQIAHQGFRGQKERGHGRRVLQRHALDLGGIDDARLQHVHVLQALGVEAAVHDLLGLDLLHDDAALEPGVLDDLTNGLLEGAPHDHGAHLLVALQLETVDLGRRPQQGDTAARHDALLDRGARGVERVLHAGLLLLHGRLRGGADLDHSHATGQLGQPLLELLAVVVRGRLLDLRPDLLDATLDARRLACALDDSAVVLVHHDLLGLAQVLELDVLELDAEVLRDGLAARQDRDVLEHGLAAITEAGGLHRRAVERAAELVHHEGGQGLALHVLGDDEEGLARARHLLEQREHILHDADLLLVDQDEGILEHALHPLGVRNEVGREVTAVELHALDHVEYRLRGLGLFHGDDAVLAHLLHGLGNEAADGLVVVGGDGRDLRDLLLVLRRLGHLLQLFRHEIHGAVDTALEAHGVGARRDVLQALTDDGVRKHGGGGGTVTRDVGGLGCDLLYHLSAHVLIVVLELDLLGHRHAILGDGGTAELLVDDHVAALGAHGRLHGGRHDVDPAEQCRTPLVAENHLLWHLILLLISVDGMGRPVGPGRNASRTFVAYDLPDARTLLKDAEHVLLAEDQVLFVVQGHLGAGVLAEEDAITGLDVERDLLAVVRDLAVANGDHLALLRLLLGAVRNDDAALLHLFLFLTLDENAVMQRANLHSQITLRWIRC